jgi:RNA polymerase sigma-70 factor, ECF subfamily
MISEAETDPARGRPDQSTALPASHNLSFSHMGSNALLSVTQFEREALPHMDDLYRTAASMLRSQTEAEDTVQETYLQAWKSFQRFTPGTNCRAWLFRILFHVIAHQRRKWFNRFISTERVDLEQTMTYLPPVPTELRDEEILGAVRKIPQQYAEVVMLADVHEFSYKEIQETLRISIGTVMSRLSRGRQLLRAQLPSYDTRIGVSRPSAGAARLQS